MLPPVGEILLANPLCWLSSSLPSIQVLGFSSTWWVTREACLSGLEIPCPLASGWVWAMQETNRTFKGGRSMQSYPYSAGSHRLAASLSWKAQRQTQVCPLSKSPSLWLLIPHVLFRSWVVMSSLPPTIILLAPGMFLFLAGFLLFSYWKEREDCSKSSKELFWLLDITLKRGTALCLCASPWLFLGSARGCGLAWYWAN